MARTCGNACKRISRRRFPRWCCDGVDSFYRLCLWRYVHFAQTGWLNNYAGVLYMQGACIFMHGGGGFGIVLQMQQVGGWG